MQWQLSFALISAAFSIGAQTAMNGQQIRSTFCARIDSHTAVGTARNAGHSPRITLTISESESALSGFAAR